MKGQKLKRRQGRVIWKLTKPLSSFIEVRDRCNCPAVYSRPNPCYLARFYMMTQTSLSAAAPASQGHLRLARGIEWHRHSCLCAVAEPGAQPIEAAALLPVNVLIANDDASSIGILSDQRESKGLSYRAPLRHQRPQLLIANLELEFRLTHRKLSPLRISNRKFSQVLRAPWRIASFSMRLHTLARQGRRANPHAEGRSPITPFLIHGTAIKSQRNPLTNSNLRISNRRQTGGTSVGILPAPSGDSSAEEREPSTSLGMTEQCDRSLTVPGHMVILAGLLHVRCLPQRVGTG
jgi:hypothetical protein